MGEGKGAVIIRQIDRASRLESSQATGSQATGGNDDNGIQWTNERESVARSFYILDGSAGPQGETRPFGEAHPATHFQGEPEPFAAEAHPPPQLFWTAISSQAKKVRKSIG